MLRCRECSGCSLLSDTRRTRSIHYEITWVGLRERSVAVVTQPGALAGLSGRPGAGSARRCSLTRGRRQFLCRGLPPKKPAGGAWEAAGSPDRGPKRPWLQ